MYEKTKQKTLEMNKPNKNDVIDMLNKAQEDIIKQAEQHDVTLEVNKPEFAINEEIKNSNSKFIKKLKKLLMMKNIKTLSMN